MTTAEQYRSTSTLLFDQAMVELEAGDLLQASEKLWGAAAQALKSVAERRGLKHDSHAQFYNIMATLERGLNLQSYADVSTSRQHCISTSMKTGWMRIRSAVAPETSANFWNRLRCAENLGTQFSSS